MTPVFDSLDSITLHVRDLDKARRFYGEVLGLPEAPLPSESGLLLFTLPGGARLLMHVQGDQEPGRPAGGPTGLMLATRDAHRSVEEVRRRGGTITDEPWKAPWGPVYATVADPDGNELVLIQRDVPLPSLA